MSVQYMFFCFVLFFSPYHQAQVTDKKKRKNKQTKKSRLNPATLRKIQIVIGVQCETLSNDIHSGSMELKALCCKAYYLKFLKIPLLFRRIECFNLKESINNIKCCLFIYKIN